jgi:hypothetical protein
MKRSKGIRSSGEEDMHSLCDAIKEHVSRYRLLIGQIDDFMFELASKWKDIGHYETIGDGIQNATAGFIAAKLTETAGFLVPTANSEDWCHVNYFSRNPDEIVTIINADVASKNRSRIGETINQAAGLGRKVLLFSDRLPQDFGVRYDIEYCCIPTPPVGFGFLHPLMDYLPGSLYTSYVAALRGESYFRGGAQFDPLTSTTTTSEISV